MDKRFNKLMKLLLGHPDIINIYYKLKCTTGKRAVLIGSPVHSNLGDHLIAENCLRLIESLEFDAIIDVPEFYYELFNDRISLNPEDVIFIVGGGWLGNDYEDAEIICRIVSKWKNNRIVILPQTIYFSNKGRFLEPEKVRKTLLSANRLLLCVRDKKSYDVAIEVLKIPSDRVFLSPDITLYGSHYLKESKKSKGVILSIRNDREKVDEKLDSTIRIILNDLNVPYTDSSTVVKFKIVPYFSRKHCILKKMKQYNRCRLVITNRLHSMIFALFSRTKCLVFDNSTHKVSETIANWLDDNPNIFYFGSSNYKDVSSQIKVCLESEYKEYNFTGKNTFKDLSNRIGVFLNEN